MFTAEESVLLAMLVCLGGAGVTWFLNRQKTRAGWVAFLCIACSSLLILVGAAQVLIHGPGKAVTFLAVEPLGFALRLYVDGLSAMFLGLIAAVAMPASFYAIDYMTHHQEHGVGRYHPNFLLFVAAMYGLVSTTDMMWFFCIFWQMMTWTGWALIRYERRRPENAWAARKYLWMMQAACGVTMLGAAMLAQTEVTTAAGERLMLYDFEAVSHHLPAMLATRSGWVAGAFTLFLVGFGIKLGKFFGVIFLSRTSELVAERARRYPSLEVGWKMRLPQTVLAAVCLLFGLMPGLALGLVGSALEASRQGLGGVLADARPATFAPWTGLGNPSLQAIYVPFAVAVVLALVFVLVRWLAKQGGASRRAAAPWLCGYAREAEANRYQASGLYGELKKWLIWLGGRPRPSTQDPEVA